MVEFRILGPIEVHRDGEQLVLGGRRQVALLALLTLHRNNWVSTDRLLEELRRDETASVSVKRIQVAISRLRRALRDRDERLIRTVPGGYLLAVESEEVDADRFQALAASGRRLLLEDRPAEARASLADALALWRGQALADVMYEPFAQAAVARLEEERLAALEARVDADLRLGAQRSLVAELEGLVRSHPTRERLSEQLMLALYRCGRQTEALDVYQRVRRHLLDESGVDPGEGLQRLQAEILAHSSSLMGAAQPPAPVAAPAREVEHGDGSPFVGRTEELGRLCGHLAATVSGADRVVVVSGDAGIGKTRLVGELMASAAAQGMRVFYGGGDEDGALSYQPFVEALEPYVSETLAQLGDEGIEEALGELARLMPTARLTATPRDPLGDPELQRFRLFQAVALVLEHAARDRPLLLVLDDLQWADRPTRQLLRHLLRAGTSGRRLIVAIHRKPGLATFLRGLRRETDVDHLELSGLAAADLAELVGERLPGAPMPVVLRLHDETAGNPLFVGEVLRSLGGHTVAESVAALDELEVPDEVVDVVAQRLERLEERTVDALKAASVAGREFDVAVLERVLSLPADDVLDALDDARTEDLILEHRDVLDRFCFSHALVRRALYKTQTRSRRSRMHLKVGSALETLGGHQPAELGHHFWHARAVGGAAQAVEHLHEAGRLADEALAWEDAARHYRDALAAFQHKPHGDLGTRGELLLALGDACERSGDSDGGKRAFAEAAELARGEHDADLLAHAALGYGRAPGMATDVDPALLALLEEARAGLGNGEDTLRARVLARLAVERSALPDARAQADALSREAVELAERGGDSIVLSIALASRHWTLSGPEGLEERCRAARRGLELAARAGDTERELAARAWWLFDLVELGEIAEVESQMAAYDGLAEALRHPSYLGYASAMHAMLALLHGELADATKQIDAATELLERANDPDAARVATLQRFLLHLERGEPKLAAEAVAKPPSDRPIWHCLAAWALCEGGETARAREMTVAPQDIARDEEWLTAMTALARALVAIGEHDAARAVYAQLEPFAERAVAIEAIVCLGAVAHPLGLLAAALGDEQAARDRLTEAVAFDERMGARFWADRARADLEAVGAGQALEPQQVSR